MPPTVNTLYCRHPWGCELVTSIARVRNSGNLFQSTVCNLILREFSCSPYYRGVRNSEVSARQKLTILVIKKKDPCHNSLDISWPLFFLVSLISILSHDTVQLHRIQKELMHCLACRTGVIFCVFQASEGKRETRVTGGAPRAFPRSPEKRKKNNACSAG